MRSIHKSLNYIPKHGIFPISVPPAHPVPLPRVFFDLALDSTPIGRVVFELYTNIAPRTAHNFIKFSEGFQHKNGQQYSYKNSEFFRIIPMRGIWGGDLGQGKSISYFGEKFVDETYNISHNQQGILTTANIGGPNSNDSRFIITLSVAQWQIKQNQKLDRRSIAFGKVINGFDLLKQLELYGSSQGQTQKKITVQDSGLVSEREYHHYDAKENFNIWESHPNHH